MGDGAAGARYNTKVTTTLRPTAPERRDPDGRRSRSYDICVNSRPVGRIDLTTDTRFGPAFGRIARLAVGERDRHRGRGTVALLAAEEVLRGWGCGQVLATVPADAATALGLMGALGYTERARGMAKPLGATPGLPAGSAARPMDEEFHRSWRSRARAAYAQDWADRGVPRDLAEDRVARDDASAQPRGLASPGCVFRVLAHDGVDVGTLWVVLRDGWAFVYDVEVADAHRRRGHGRSLMHLAEIEGRAGGARTMGLNVFAGNAAALRLYESLGYEPTEIDLYKPLL
ncbi:GNAT family N-acetyltransferase [Streptomyces hesseae]|uniref:GNAT family N-acetyltransferase n=1 Tax=Streptomyces hesseae TaxID=3075519 RepID=A0ABU2SLD4_9ACTN|nr:GNAT family N-acetyltransferase [Streptomyces sp. DSM 40473]MDT0449802.1 GNAT family N-acetyltransferase [Streptomyces sp. DSM 40473]